MEPASLLIDEASDLAYENKAQEAIEKYREALEALDRIEMENAERAKTPEFASLRNKRAYVNAAIDSLLLAQVQMNAKAVAVSDTTELEKRLAEEKAKARGEAEDKAAEKTSPKKEPAADAAPKKNEPAAEEAPKAVAEAKAPAVEKKPVPVPAKPLSKREQAMQDIANGDYTAADLVIRSMLDEKPNNATALNLRAVMEVSQGKLKDAERTLDQAIMSNPRSHYAFYNMARLLLKIDAADKEAAKRYYETGRSVGGPEDAELEALVR